MYIDEKDLLLIHYINENRHVVFETSRFKIMIGERWWKVKRCKNSVALAASVCHPMLQEQLPQATMEFKSENSTNIGRFWNNKAFKDVTKTDKNFSPVGWVMDMVTANFNGLQLIYVKDILDKIKGCKFHFHQYIIRHASKCSDQ